MRKSILLALLLSFSAISAQNFRADSIFINTISPDSCSTINVDVKTYLGCANFVQGPSSFSIVGSNIDFAVNYTSSPICAGAISFPVFSLFLDSIPVNTYATTATAFLDGIPINTINGPNLIVASCLATSISESRFKDLKVYPNPTKDRLYIENLSRGDFSSIRLLDISGKEISLPLSFQNGSLVLNLEDLDSGIYFLNIQNDDELTMKKIVVN